MRAASSIPQKYDIIPHFVRHMWETYFLNQDMVFPHQQGMPTPPRTTHKHHALMCMIVCPWLQSGISSTRWPLWVRRAASRRRRAYPMTVSVSYRVPLTSPLGR